MLDDLCIFVYDLSVLVEWAFWRQQQKNFKGGGDCLRTPSAISCCLDGFFLQLCAELAVLAQLRHTKTSILSMELIL